MNYCTSCEEEGRLKVAATHQAGGEWMCAGCFLGDDTIKGVERRCTCGRLLSSYAKEGELCPSCAGVARKGVKQPPKPGPKMPTPSSLDAALEEKVKIKTEPQTPLISSNLNTMLTTNTDTQECSTAPLCKCGCGRDLPKKNRTGYIWKHWPKDGPQPWSRVAKSKSSPNDIPAKPLASATPRIAPGTNATADVKSSVREVLTDLRLDRSRLDAAIASLEALYPGA